MRFKMSSCSRSHVRQLDLEQSLKMGGVWRGRSPPREQTHMQVDVSMCSRSHVRQLDLDQVFNITRAETGCRTPFLSKRRPWGMPGQALGPFWGSLGDPGTPCGRPGPTLKGRVAEFDASEGGLGGPKNSSRVIF